MVVGAGGEGGEALQACGVEEWRRAEGGKKRRGRRGEREVLASLVGR